MNAIFKKNVEFNTAEKFYYKLNKDGKLLFCICILSTCLKKNIKMKKRRQGKSRKGRKEKNILKFKKRKVGKVENNWWKGELPVKGERYWEVGKGRLKNIKARG